MVIRSVVNNRRRMSGARSRAGMLSQRRKAAEASRCCIPSDALQVVLGTGFVERRVRHPGDCCKREEVVAQGQAARSELRLNPHLVLSRINVRRPTLLRHYARNHDGLIVSPRRDPGPGSRGLKPWKSHRSHCVFIQSPIAHVRAARALFTWPRVSAICLARLPA